MREGTGRNFQVYRCAETKSSSAIWNHRPRSIETEKNKTIIQEDSSFSDHHHTHTHTRFVIVSGFWEVKWNHRPEMALGETQEVGVAKLRALIMRTTPDELYGSEEEAISIRSSQGTAKMRRKKKMLVTLQKCEEVTAATVQGGGIQRTITWWRKGKKAINHHPAFALCQFSTRWWMPAVWRTLPTILRLNCIHSVA